MSAQVYGAALAPRRERVGAGPLGPLTVAALCVVDEEDRLIGSVQLVQLLRAPSGQPVGDLADRQVVCVGPDSDLSDIALLMADYNLVAIPVVDDDDHVIGLITVDDVLEATIPEDWRRRQPAPHPEHPHPDDTDQVPVASRGA